MEDLLTLFDKVQQTVNLSVLSQEIVLVQNPGMQHWLNMQQANISGISMNASFVLPAQFLWKQLRLLSGDEVPEQSPYSREVLAWRIDKLLQTDTVISNSDCQQATKYWHKANDADPLKRFQLAVQLADLYEQYLIYRPSWISAWAKGDLPEDFSGANESQSKWQGIIWKLLHEQIAYDPQYLFNLAKQNIEINKDLLPKRISIFGINALAPMWVDFLSLISEVTDVHFYHLNPCYEYWGDIQTDKAKAKRAYLAQIEKWPQDSILDDIANPLLANLGQQGREFLTQLHLAPNIEIPLFDQLFEEQNTAGTDTAPSVLMRIQKDILTLADNRNAPTEMVDDSITITSAHSALREVQGLHDYLLHLFNDDPTLTPKDVLVMCPQIEQYAAYIDSVFVRGWEDLSDSIPPLPCSIADRVSKDSEPLVAAFSDLLSLPDSRFQVTAILSYLRLLPLQLKFGLSEPDIELIADWLDKANVHWGLNEDHKKSHLNVSNSNGQYTWKQGLDRLLLGFAYGDSTTLYQDDMVLPWVEGSNAIILGKLMLLCQQLSSMSAELSSAKTAEDWQKCLQSYLDILFAKQDNDVGLTIIQEAIDSLTVYCKHAEYNDVIELSVIREYLNHHFSQPDPGRQFMIGQITFCSMLPMRSIPFKVIAVLGLNDGEFPRQRQPLGFDLMDLTKPKLGDRSRRGDDRYLFLEAIISARENLYLSYQGNDIKNNNERQPSIVLREMMDYLQQAYGWQFNAGQELRQMPLQVFSFDNFDPKNRYQSFDQKWLQLASSTLQATQPVNIALPEEINHDVSLADLLNFIVHPSKTFAEQRLKLFLGRMNEQLSDAEPFSISHLDKYLYQQDVLMADVSQINSLNSNQSQNTASLIDDIHLLATRSGNFPDTPVIESQLGDWQRNMLLFKQAINQKIARLNILTMNTENQYVELTTEINSESWNVHSHLELYSTNTANLQLLYRPARVKSKDVCRLYLQHLLACSQVDLTHKPDGITSYGFYFNEKENQLQTIAFDHVVDAKERLTQILKIYLQGLQTPLLVNAQLGEAFYWQKDAFVDSDIEQHIFLKSWQDQHNMSGLESDAYMQYFWPEAPLINQFSTPFSELYKPMYQSLSFEKQDIDLVLQTPVHSDSQESISQNGGGN